jgi:hypothetical protein
MDFGEAVKTCFRKYFVFRGRGQRSEYWYFYLFTILGGIVFSILDAVLFGSSWLGEETGTESMMDILFASPPVTIQITVNDGTTTYTISRDFLNMGVSEPFNINEVFAATLKVQATGTATRTFV